MTKIIDKEGGEISITEFKDNGKKKFKVTRRFSDLSLAETKVFDSKEEAKRRLEEWLR